MSLLRPIIRACAVAALRDQTWALDRVYDSDMRPFATAVMGRELPQPYAVVYTDSDDLPTVLKPGMLYSSQTRLMSLIVELGSANSIRKTAAGPVTIQFALTDEGQELTVDILSWQTVNALFGDPKSPWGEILKKLINRPTRVTTRRGGQNQAGIRFAARRITYTVQPVWEIIPNLQPPETHPIWEFCSLADQYPASGCKDVADAVRFVMAGGAGSKYSDSAASWRVAQSALGMFTKAVKMVNPDGTPLPWGEEEGEVPVEQPPYDVTGPTTAAPLGTLDSDEVVPVLTDIELDDESPGPNPDITMWPDVTYYD